MLHVLAVLSAVLFQGGVTAGADPAATLLDRLAGRWVMRGEIAGQRTVHDLTATWVLNRGYLQLHEVSREKDPQGRPQYEAIIHVTRDAKTGEVACLWLDNTATSLFAPEGVGLATPDGNALPFLFRTPKGEVTFSNVFAYDATTNTWQWRMDNVEHGVHKPFGLMTLSRR